MAQTDLALKNSEELFKQFHNIIVGLESHGRLFYINEAFARMLSSANLTPFIINSLFEGLKQSMVVQTPHVDSHPSYLG
jgi:hypothetical protein